MPLGRHRIVVAVRLSLCCCQSAVRSGGQPAPGVGKSRDVRESWAGLSALTGGQARPCNRQERAVSA
jgi:hypothetical protein